MRSLSHLRLGIIALIGLSLLVAACGSASSTAGSSATCPSTKLLSGTGSTFDNPLFQKFFTEYANAKCGVHVSYTATGSGAGISQLLAQTVDFGATDGPLTDAQQTSSTNGPILHVPVTAGGVVMTFNLQKEGVTNLQLTGPLIAQIFLGKITKWNDPALTALNTGVTLPDLAISVVHRSDGSGTTNIFTHYLAAVSPDWANGPKAGSTINWPVGIGSKGNDGVAASVKQTDGALAYNELTYSLANNITSAKVQNKNGEFVAGDLTSVNAAVANFLAQNGSSVPADLRFYIVDAPGAGSYPISGFSWVIVYQNQTNADKGAAVATMLWWMVTTGQQYSNALYYAQLPQQIVAKSEAQINAMKCGGAACYTGLFGK